MLPRHPRAWTALLSGLFLTACASPPSIDIPASLLTCASRPDVPTIRTDADLAGWVLDLDQAGEDCRGKLERVKGVIDER